MAPRGGVSVEGKPQTRSWYSTEIVVEAYSGTIRLVDAKPEAEVLSDVAPDAAAA